MNILYWPWRTWWGCDYLDCQEDHGDHTEDDQHGDKDSLPVPGLGGHRDELLDIGGISQKSGRHMGLGEQITSVTFPLFLRNLNSSGRTMDNGKTSPGYFILSVRPDSGLGILRLVIESIEIFSSIIYRFCVQRLILSRKDRLCWGYNGSICQPNWSYRISNEWIWAPLGHKMSNI